MDLGSVIEALYPSADGRTDYRVTDDGTGARIEHWNEAKLGPRPTAEQLASGETAATALAARRHADADAFASAVALLKQNYAAMTPVQKALCVVLRRVVREMREDA